MCRCRPRLSATPAVLTPILPHLRLVSGEMDRTPMEFANGENVKLSRVVWSSLSRLGRAGGGDGGIRTLGTLIEYGSLAGNWFQPLTHVSGSRLCEGRAYRRAGGGHQGGVASIWALSAAGSGNTRLRGRRSRAPSLRSASAASPTGGSANSLAYPPAIRIRS